MFGSGIPNPNITDETGKRIASAIEALAGGNSEEPVGYAFGSGIPNPNLTDETGKRIAGAIEALTPGGGGGAERFAVIITPSYDEETEEITYEADRTFEEIEAAVQGNSVVVAKLNPTEEYGPVLEFPLSNILYDEFVFSGIVKNTDLGAPPSSRYYNIEITPYGVNVFSDVIPSDRLVVNVYPSDDGYEMDTTFNAIFDAIQSKRSVVARLLGSPYDPTGVELPLTEYNVNRMLIEGEYQFAHFAGIPKTKYDWDTETTSCEFVNIRIDNRRSGLSITVETGSIAVTFPEEEEAES